MKSRKADGAARDLHGALPPQKALPGLGAHPIPKAEFITPLEATEAVLDEDASVGEEGEETAVHAQLRRQDRIDLGLLAREEGSDLGRLVLRDVHGLENSIHTPGWVDVVFPGAGRGKFEIRSLNFKDCPFFDIR